MIWGIASGALVEKGIQNPHSIQVPDLIRASLALRWVAIALREADADDLTVVADLYIVLFNSIRVDASTGHGREGIYFGENGEHRMYQVAKAIAEALVTLGRSDNPEPSSFTKEETDKYSVVKIHYLDNIRDNNSRCRGNRSRVIGWKPVKTTEDFLASIKPEIEALAKKWAM
ncbi:hypothetical protein CVT25_006072 [Psilocybe cyanescens]|uniref:NAD(P)-binding domain-containing protein n=1 Tax=Psilocybe cyanescens TaxID=93625 RepID=A0A409VMN8_PSICY|nr:hypothetical protein CVT25_006072 [Psilocybe cyanescens]